MIFRLMPFTFLLPSKLFRALLFPHLTLWLSNTPKLASAFCPFFILIRNHRLALKLTVISTDGSQVCGKIFIDGKQSAQQNGAVGSISISSVLP
ncbi:hypothetical protein IDJ77_12005 [Mucilaginibacter sp. ZT4R22]|uniref:Secreted protein n=1 Tax=Mucilaginibacter pankratovii TaxID=2772110 RepID=A0ABR7WT11_9SPHI|nr:hypothetical protein [Mucilaginibacter pankratovii]